MSRATKERRHRGRGVGSAQRGQGSKGRGTTGKGREQPRRREN